MVSTTLALSPRHVQPQHRLLHAPIQFASSTSDGSVDWVRVGSPKARTARAECGGAVSTASPRNLQLVVAPNASTVERSVTAAMPAIQFYLKGMAQCS